jgi:hypothetical protein
MFRHPIAKGHEMPPRVRRLLTFLLVLVALTATGIASAQAASRLGGKVRRAWPQKSAHPPKTGLTRWLARQVGPRDPVPCAKRGGAAHARCAGGHRRGRASASSASPVSVLVRASGDGAYASQTERIQLRPIAERRPLQLIRSFDIPVDDPAYGRLLNWSYTYDSAVAATAFASVDLPDQAGRLLDQLAALQHKDGSIEYAFNVKTGASSATVRSGSVAFEALAFTDYDSTFGGTLYLDNARRAADYLLSLRNEEGLVRGGPDVDWVSTQHNILTLLALTGLVQELEGQGDEAAAAGYREAAEVIAKGIDSQLIVRGEEPTHFREGLNDEIVPLDTQALGIIYAIYRKDPTLAKEVYEYAQKNFAIDGRTIELSKKPSTYNMTYQASGPFTGYRPYLGKGAPDVLWFEGTAEMRFVSSFLGQPTDQLDASMNSWWDVTRKQGLAPLGADRTVTNSPYNEYHVWPTAAAGAWTVLSRAATDTDWANPAPETQAKALAPAG